VGQSSPLPSEEEAAMDMNNVPSNSSKSVCLLKHAIQLIY